MDVFNMFKNMDVSNMLKNVINDENNSKKEKSSIKKKEEKDRLKKQINQLKSIILQIEWSLGISKFKNNKCIIQPSSISSLRTDDIQDINLQLESELYRYSGFYCVKFTKQEYIFNFSSSSKYDKDNIFAIQIINDQNKGVLGKWVMPMAIDLKAIISDFPIEKLKNIPCLLKTCKQHIDSYFIRHEQYTALMRSISNIKNCKLQTNLGYTQINLELIGVYNKSTDSYMAIIIYLLYEINEARPHKIEIDSVIEEELDKMTKKRLRSSLACFKQFDLHTAFEKMLNKGEFTWTKDDHEESLLDINPSNNSDQEGFLDSFTLPQKRSLRLEKKKQQMRKRKKISGNENFINTSNESDEKNPISSENKGQESKKKQKITKKEKFINISSKAHKKSISFENKEQKLKKRWKLSAEKKFLNSSDTDETDRNSISPQNKELELKNIKQPARQQNVSVTKSTPTKSNPKQKKLKQKKFINNSDDTDKNSVSPQNKELELKNMKQSMRQQNVSVTKSTPTKSNPKQKKLKQKKFINNSDDTDKNSVSPQNKELELKNMKQSMRQQNVNITKSTPNIPNPRQKKLKQTKLKFETNHSELQNSSNTVSSDTTVSKNGQRNKLNKPFTSTPIRRSKYHPPNFNASVNMDISNITVSDNNVQPTKLLRNKMKGRMKSLTETTLRKSERISVNNRSKKFKYSI